MAKLIRHHWKLAMIHVLLVTLALVIWIGWSVSHDKGGGRAFGAIAGDAQQQIASLDVLTYSRLRELRDRLSLTNQDLAAMGCSQEQATAVLSSVLTWYQANSSNWSQAESAEVAAHRNLQEAIRRINVGPRDEALIATVPRLKSTLSSATTARRQLEEGAASAVASQLSPAQTAVWSSARANATFPDRYRYAAGLTAAQAQQLEEAIYKGSLSVVEPGVVTGNAKTAQLAAWTAINANLAGVQQAEESVLPRACYALWE